MTMSDGEIITSFNQAKDKSAQVSVLADLNMTSRMQMRAYLEKLGVDLSCIEGRKPPATKKLDEKKAMDRYLQGMSDKEAAKELGIAMTTFAKWRANQGLPSNPQKRLTTKDKTRFPTEEPLSEAASGADSITVTCLLGILSGFAEQYPDAKVYLEDQKMPVVRMSVLYATGHPVEAEIYLLEAEISEGQKGR